MSKMNGGRSDASTSTDDVKDRPLCLFYFNHPFGILSPSPPTVSAAPPSFYNMEPLSNFFWPAAAAAASATAAATSADETYPSSSPSVRYELGAATVHPSPVVVSLGLPRQDCSLAGGAAPAPAWYPPRTRILPPLRLPSPRDLADQSEDDVWPRRCLNRFSLPPIELPVATPPPLVPLVAPVPRCDGPIAECASRDPRCRRQVGVRKARPPRRRAQRGARRPVGAHPRSPGSARAVLACLMRRATRAGCSSGVDCGASPAPALRRVLATIREAWAAPPARAPALGKMVSRMHVRGASERDTTTEGDSSHESGASETAMPTRACARALLGELPPRPDASPGLMCRRYSVPETVMRKYRLAQQNCDSEESSAMEGGAGAWSACASPARSGAETPSPRHLRRDRELMRKSALLRRMWARPPVPAPTCSCEREARSLDASRVELHDGGDTRQPRARWPVLKRQRLDPRPPSTGDFTDSTCNPEPSPYLETTDALSDHDRDASPLGRRSSGGDGATAGQEEDRSRSFDDSDTFSSSISTAKETPCSRDRACSDIVSSNGHVEALACERLHDDNGNATSPSRADSLAGPLASDRPPPYELLEISVSESTPGTPLTRAVPGPLRASRDLNIDEYVSRVLVESLASLSDRLDGMSESVAGAGDSRLNVVEKEIKVRLQNAAVNTVVHLSPTSNHQIIFGNEELCEDRFCREEETTDECNNPRAPSLTREQDNNNASPSPSPPSRSDTFEAVLQHDNVNRAVLHQIQKLFRDEMHHSESEASVRCGAFAAPKEHCAVEDLLESGGDTIEVRTRGAGISGVGAGNYYRDAGIAAVVPRLSAYPHSLSMEVNTSSSEDADPDPLGSDCASLVDSLDDPNSPRGQLRRRDLALPRDCTTATTTAEAFFVGIRDDEPAPLSAGDGARVAEYMPERIRQKLHRRHRKRELRMECARRGKVRQLKEELERRRRDELARARRDLDRQCNALLDALLDDVIARVARDECARMRLARTRHLPAPRHVHGKLVARPSLAHAPSPALDPSPAPGPRRIYQKSEIREGDKCIEILEILEFATAAHSSPESTPSDETERGRARRSRIPVPVSAPPPPPADDHMRLTGGAALLLHAAAAAAAEPRDRSHLLRFKRVFDMIPEERTSLSLDSADAEDPAPPLPPPAVHMRSAATSPPPAEARHSQTTMTSPNNKSAATSPLRAPATLRRREGCGERVERPPRVRGDADGELGPPERGGQVASGAGGGGGTGDSAGSSSSGSSSGGSLLCSLAPRWLSAHARHRRRARAGRHAPRPAPPDGGSSTGADAGGWSVTVAGSCRASLPQDVEMRLRFPQESRRRRRVSAPTAAPAAAPCLQECQFAEDSPRGAPALPPAERPLDRPHRDHLTLTMKREAQDSSIVASKSVRKSADQLPDLETYRASRSQLRSSVKTRRGYSLHCWLPDDEPAPIRVNNGLSVLGCAIIPELKPRVPTMSERDLTRVYTPRHYLRS